MTKTLESASAMKTGKPPDSVCRVEFQPTRRSALSKIKAEAMRLGTNGTREGCRLAEKLFKALPELRNV